MMSKEETKKWNKGWKEFWMPLLTTNGAFDEEKIKNEMHDLVFIYEQVGKVYCELTGNLLSKPMHYAETIIDLHNEEVNKSYDEGFDEGKSVEK